jgi:hypothetical protein
MEIHELRKVENRVPVGFDCDHCHKNFIYEFSYNDHLPDPKHSMLSRTLIQISDFGGRTKIVLCDDCAKLFWDFVKQNSIQCERFSELR